MRLNTDAGRRLFEQASKWVEEAIPEAQLPTGQDLRYVGATLTLRFHHGPGQVTPDMVRERFNAQYGEGDGRG